MGKIYMVGAMKGGVGKTVTVFNLAYALKDMGKRVLAVDFDPQANLTTCFGGDGTEENEYSAGSGESDGNGKSGTNGAGLTIGDLMISLSPKSGSWGSCEA